MGAKGTVRLIDPEEELRFELTQHSQLMFERYRTKHGIPPTPINQIAKEYPINYVMIAAFYALQHDGTFTSSFASYERRWNGIDMDGTPGDEEEEEESTEVPTMPAQLAGS